MHYASIDDLSKSYGIKPLFQHISFYIEQGDKIALVARNGAGKSTLLKIIAGKETADSGSIWIHKDVKTAFLEQQPEFENDKTVLENILEQDHPVLNVVRRYEAMISGNKAADAAAMSAVTAEMDILNAWNYESLVKQVIGKLALDPNQLVNTLSGGQLKRMALAHALLDMELSPEQSLLIMDEPTNHLDVDMIEWLENYLQQANVTLLLVTHDRYFLDNVCNEVLEIDGVQLYIYKGDYENFLEKKAAREEAEKASVEKARNTFRKELEWMRRQPKARTTKSKSRIDAFDEVKEKAHTKLTTPELELNMKMSRLGGKILELKKVYKAFDDKKILQGFDYTFKKGERIGIVGSNGVGKSTFLNLLLGEETPDSGKINTGETVVFGYYSQEGLQINEDMRVIEYVKDIAENFTLADGTKLGAAQFLNLFLFPPEQQYTYISNLSGGEKRRLHLLTILFRNPNFLILDEPTNDLDLQTLNILEEFLASFPGCLIIVSHDRYFMDRLIDHLFVFEGAGKIKDYPGNYSQYRRWLKQTEAAQKKQGNSKAKQKQEALSAPKRDQKKLSYNEQRELRILEKEIPKLEKEKQELERNLSSGELEFEKLQELSERIGKLNEDLDNKEMRWLELNESVE